MRQEEAPPTDTIALTLHVPLSALTPVLPPPVYVTQKNVEQVLGIEPDTFLRLLRTGFAGKVTREGKLRIVRRDAFEAWLDKRGRCIPVRAVKPARPANDTSALDSPEAVAASLNLFPVRSR